MNCKFQPTGKPTYWPTNKDKIPGLIDFFCSEEWHPIAPALKSHDLVSDHSNVKRNDYNQTTTAITANKWMDWMDLEKTSKK